MLFCPWCMPGTCVCRSFECSLFLMASGLSAVAAVVLAWRVASVTLSGWPQVLSLAALRCHVGLKASGGLVRQQLSLSWPMAHGPGAATVLAPPDLGPDRACGRDLQRRARRRSRGLAGSFALVLLRAGLLSSTRGPGQALGPEQVYGRPPLGGSSQRPV